MTMSEGPVELAQYNWQAYAVLVVDGDETMRRFLERALARRFGMVQVAADVAQAAVLMTRLHFDLLILDHAPAGNGGIAWLHEARAQGYAGEAIVVAASADLDTAIAALRAGASDFILKPFRLEQVLDAIRRGFERGGRPRAQSVLRREPDGASSDALGIVGQSAAIEQLRGLIGRVGRMPSTVLLLGESGSGKEVAARALHEASPRAQQPFVPLNCAAIPAELVESELFGHVRGAFTGATENRDGMFHHAHGGTLFLDEISELPLPMQTRLLRVLEERRVRPLGAEREVPVDVRIIAASNRDLAAEAAAGRFREDLYFRLAVIELVMPPLRARTDDIPALVRHFMETLAARLEVAPLALGHELLARLAAHSWPGNVRELRNFVERALILGAFPLDALEAAPVAAAADELDLSLEEVEKRHIVRVVEACGGNKTEAARRLGVSRKTLERKFADWGAAGEQDGARGGDGKRAAGGIGRRA
ncbi:MAG: sigma-54-dependent Fis family transcriptional regulator [Thauera phenolivorans]|uniref:Sigma-54-dependent Fis family transcriptional regulator n=1 Tax=Thauera phenolivorans TaxID=1792543 RepID=A0A7X7LUF2_9RHOO|nr:sigma-54-dependent Fis family transcriptional regulator [Thauera phenolivorans]